MDDNIRVRFAPSPTGFLHVGGARTAIFNWLYAKNKKGKFLLRIEDTDPERSKSELSEQILRSMEWLGMSSDEPIVYQALNIERHRQASMELLADKKAYYAFETAEELDQQRKLAQRNKTQYKYNRASLKIPEEKVKQYLDEGRPFAIRFKVPDGITEFEDIVHGKTTFNNSEIDDFIILRSDGSPVYQVAVVIDDHDMRISHVIRGDDHLSNTPKQILLYNAFGWKVPVFAHLPMILDEEKKKLSKRRNTVSVEEYKDKGYMADALFNFLTLLGFAPPLSFKERVPGGEVSAPEKLEVVSKNELVNIFTFDRVNKSSAVFDMKKLNWINSEYIKSADEGELVKIIHEKLNKTGINESESYIKSVVTLMKERVYTINDFVEFGSYFFTDPDSYDEKGITKYWNPEIKPLFENFATELEELDDWNSEKIEEKLRNFADLNGIKAAQLIHLLRLSVTGITVSPGIFEVLEILTKKTVINRINNFLGKN
ncbi:MAG: glutamate--tRNA ligase [Ignavibacteria bacterium]